jgi:hypothetical protein
MVCYVNHERTCRISWPRTRWSRPRAGDDSATALGVTAGRMTLVETGDSGRLPGRINLPNDQLSATLRQQSRRPSPPTRPTSDRRPRLRTSSDTAEAARIRWAGLRASSTEMHEVIGHGSGRMAARTSRARTAREQHWPSRDPGRPLALHFHPIQTRRAGLMPADTPPRSCGRIRAVHARRPGSCAGKEVTAEEDHMRNRQLTVNWLVANTSAIEVRVAGKTYVMTPQAPRRRWRPAPAESRCSLGEGDWPPRRGRSPSHGGPSTPPATKCAGRRCDCRAIGALSCCYGCAGVATVRFRTFAVVSVRPRVPMLDIGFSAPIARQQDVASCLQAPQQGSRAPIESQ